jgi:hypothetical protein
MGICLVFFEKGEAKMLGSLINSHIFLKFTPRCVSIRDEREMNGINLTQDSCKRQIKYAIYLFFIPK